MRGNGRREIVAVDHAPVPDRRHLGGLFYVRASNRFYVVEQRPNGAVEWMELATLQPNVLTTPTRSAAITEEP